MRSSLDYFNGAHCLSFEGGSAEVRAALAPTGYEPTGYFWEGVAEYLAPELSEELEFDSEEDAFVAYGPRDILEALQSELDPYLAAPEALAALVGRAEGEGFIFDD